MKNIQEKGAYVFFTLVLITGFLLLGEGITGMVSVEFEETYCSDNLQCTGGLVCCKFYGEDSGICAESSECESINSITREEKIVTSQGLIPDTQMINLIKSEKPNRLAQELPIIIVALCLIGLGIFYHNREKDLKEMKRKAIKNENKSMAGKRKSTKRSRTKR